MKKLLIALAVSLSLPISAQAAPIAVPADKAEEAAKMVAAMVVAGRAVIAGQQKNINDASKGDKGLTPDVFEKMMLEQFEKANGTSVDKIVDPSVKAATKATVDAAKKAVANSQGRINEPGKAFKGFIPAVFGRLTGNILKGESGIEMKQTTDKVRNEYNKPDEFETKILNQFLSSKPKTGHGEKVGNRYRYLLPVYITEACLSCHGDPKGEIDIAGKAKEGYKVGDLRGAISVSIPLQ